MEASQQFNGVLAVEGQEANGVVFALGALTWPESVPLFLGFDGGRIGRVEQIERAPGGEIRGEVFLDRDRAVLDQEFGLVGEPFELDDDGIVGFGLSVHVDGLEREGDEGPFTGGRITAVAAMAHPAFRYLRATPAQPASRSAASVWKFELDVDDEQIVAMPAGSELLYAGTQRPRDPSRVTLWARVLPCGPEEFVQRRILIRGTGHPVADEPYVGTVVFPAEGGVVSLVWHVFDGGES